jgi:CRP/FNR family transcriptional regulator, cyclic AMP receptor protein
MPGDELKKFSLFEALDKSTRDLVRSSMDVVTIEGGNYLFREGDESTGMFLLVEGECEVRKNVNDQAIAVARIKCNRIFGEMSVMSTGMRSASVFFSKNAKLLLWPKEKYIKFLHSHPSAGVEILFKLCEVIARRMVVRDEEVTQPGVSQGELTTFRKKLASDWSI